MFKKACKRVLEMQAETGLAIGLIGVGFLAVIGMVGWTWGSASMVLLGIAVLLIGIGVTIICDP